MTIRLSITLRIWTKTICDIRDENFVFYLLNAAHAIQKHEKNMSYIQQRFTIEDISINQNMYQQNHQKLDISLKKISAKLPDPNSSIHFR